MLRLSALITAVFMCAAAARAQNPTPAPSGPSTPAEAAGVQQPVVQPPPPQTPAQPATIQPAPAPAPAPAAPPILVPPVAISPMPAAPGAVAPTAPTTAVIGAAPAPAPLLPAGTLTAERAATAATYLQHAAELIDKALGDRQGTKDLKEAGTVQIDRATLDDIRTAIGQVMSMLK